MKIYVASSWQSTYHRAVVMSLRLKGYEVYNYREKNDLFHWKNIDPFYEDWDRGQFIKHLRNPLAEDALTNNMIGLKECDVCIGIAPLGISTSLEIGWACGAEKVVYVYLPEYTRAELMLGMVDYVTDDFRTIIERLSLMQTEAFRQCDAGGRA